MTKGSKDILPHLVQLTEATEGASTAAACMAAACMADPIKWVRFYQAVANGSSACIFGEVRGCIVTQYHTSSFIPFVVVHVLPYAACRPLQVLTVRVTRMALRSRRQPGRLCCMPSQVGRLCLKR